MLQLFTCNIYEPRVLCLNVSPSKKKPLLATSVTHPHINQGMYLASFGCVVYNYKLSVSE